ncbi:MAG: DUF1559 domain-containing protein [Planctomycetaceae bacterium]|nr:DUF1559 domain-containing protein [Planctomycetaceae bacterium]
MDRTTFANDPSTCQNSVLPADRSLLDGTRFNNWRGNTRFCGRISDAGGFVTILPPNSPSCLAGELSPYYASGIGSAGSRHTGGVNIALGDGSVTFVSATVDCGRTSDPSPGSPSGLSSGRSPYNVWGAMGTRAGGESTSTSM